jgi:hypothetical protein
LSDQENLTPKNSLPRRSLARAVLTGIAFFFPGFIFSLPVTCTWADRHYAGEAQATLGAIAPSIAIGVLSAIGCTIYLIRKHKTRA